MIIDSLADKNAIDVGTLNFDLPEKQKFSFDVDKEVTPFDWQKMLDLREGHIKAEHWIDFLTLATMMSVIFPDRKMDLQTSDDTWAKILALVNRERSFPSWGYWYRAMRIWLINPEKGEELGLGKTEWETIKDQRAESAREVVGFQGDLLTGRVHQYLIYSLASKVLFPKEAADVKINDALWRKIKGVLLLPEEWNDGETYGFAGYAMMVKLLDPEKAGSLLNRTTWKKMHQQLERLREDGPLSVFAVRAAAMKILAADEARISSEGKIEVIVDKNSSEMQERIPEMPVKRAF